jgi:hypothetical protein
MPALQNGIFVGVKHPFWSNFLASILFSPFLLIQLGDVIPAWHRYPDLRLLAHRLKVL